MVTVALLSDIHGNLPALETVAEDLRSHSPDAVFVLGDMINGCPWSDRVLDRLLEYGWPMLLGNHDDAVLQLDTPRMEPRYADRQRYATLWWTRDQLSPRHLALLESLPTEMQLSFYGVALLRLVHGIPGSFFVGLRPDSPEGWVARQLEPLIESTLAGGHTHVPMIRRIRRWLVINTGSVAACYDGDVRASYALLHGDGHDWHVEIRRVAYDLSAVDAGYHETGLLTAGGVMAEMFRRSVMSGQPWVSDFTWWIREQPAEVSLDMRGALQTYDAAHGPGRWAFPYA
jgi:predicted phosphodiesterase